MKKSEVNILNELNEELKDIWKQNQRKISEIESDYPDIKKRYEGDIVYNNYLELKITYSVFSLLQKYVEKFIDTENKNVND